MYRKSIGAGNFEIGRCRVQDGYYKLLQTSPWYFPTPKLPFHFNTDCFSSGDDQLMLALIAGKYVRAMSTKSRVGEDDEMR